MIAVAIFLTYSLQFYVPMEIIWKSIRHRFVGHPKMYESFLRAFIVTCTGKWLINYCFLNSDRKLQISFYFSTVVIAALVPQLGPFISLIGAVCLSMLGLIFPSIIEMVTYQAEGNRTSYIRITKNIVIISFGILGFATGAYTSIQEIIESHFKPKTQWLIDPNNFWTVSFFFLFSARVYGKRKIL